MEKNPVLFSKLSLESDIPLYSQLVNIIKRNITAGTLAPGDLIPSESELCKTFDISRSTVRQAVNLRGGAENEPQDGKTLLLHHGSHFHGLQALVQAGGVRGHRANAGHREDAGAGRPGYPGV